MRAAPCLVPMALAAAVMLADDGMSIEVGADAGYAGTRAAAGDVRHRPWQPGTSMAFTGWLKAASIQVSMDGRGRRPGNLFIERLRRPLKHEEVHLKGEGDGRKAWAGIAGWIGFYKSAPQHPSVYVTERGETS